MNRRLLPILAVVGVMAAASRPAAAGYTHGAYEVDQILFRSSAQSGTATEYGCGSSCGWVAARVTDGTLSVTKGIAVRFRVYWTYTGPPYPPPVKSTIPSAALEGSKTVSGTGSATATAGYNYTPYISIDRDTTSDGNPFSTTEQPGSYNIPWGGGYMVIDASAEVTTSAGGNGSATGSAESTVWFTDAA